MTEVVTSYYSKMSYPTKHQPAPPRSGFQLFAVDAGRKVNGTWTVQQYHNAWGSLQDEERRRWNEKGEAEAQRYQREFQEWEQNGGEAWVKRLREVTERGVLSTKTVGSEMRKIPCSVKPEAVRVMTTAVEAFMGTFAMESFVHTPAEDKKKLALLDMHKLIHESDARFGFLASHFEHPSIFGPTGKKKKSKKALKDAAKFAPNATSTDAQQMKEKPEKLIKPVHRPKMEFSNVVKMYEGRNAGGPPWDTLSSEQRDEFTEQFKQMKTQFVQAEEKWKKDYPEEYDAMMKKRELDRERTRKRKEQGSTGTAQAATPGQAGTEGNGSSMVQMGGVDSGSLSPMAMMNMQAQPMFPQAYMQQQGQMHYNMQQHMAQANQLNFRSVADPSMYAQGPVQKRIIVEDPSLKPPWKKVHVLNGYTNALEDEYYWNTQTNQTSWDYPWVK